MTPRRIAVLVLISAALAGCRSPEATRSRGGGAGADVGNRSKEVKIHEGSEPYWKTPEHITGAHPSLEPARHAREQSRR